MAYKNFFFRFIFSIIFILIYLLILSIDFELIFYLILLIFFFICIEIILNFKTLKFIPIISLIISLYFLFNINFSYEEIYKFNLFVVTVISFDTFSYTTGKLYGKTKILSISPNKTLEGLIGGILFSVFFSLAYCLFFNFLFDLKLIIFILTLIILAFIGDIVESFFKRKNNLKNSSNFIPGHGGIFDRFDSFLFSIIFYSISNNYLL